MPMTRHSTQQELPRPLINTHISSMCVLVHTSFGSGVGGGRLVSTISPPSSTPAVFDLSEYFLAATDLVMLVLCGVWTFVRTCVVFLSRSLARCWWLGSGLSRVPPVSCGWLASLKGVVRRWGSVSTTPRERARSEQQVGPIY